MLYNKIKEHVKMTKKQHVNQMRAILKHSKNIKVLDRSILILIFVAIGILFYPILMKDELKTADGTKLYKAVQNKEKLDNIFEITNSTISGINDKNELYEITSVNTWNSKENQNIIHMSGITATLKFQNNKIINLYGDNATLDNNSKILRLTDNIEIHTNNEPTLIIDNVAVYLNKNEIAGASPVFVNYNDFCITSSNFAVTENGNKVSFGDGINFKINNEKKECEEI